MVHKILSLYTWEKIFTGYGGLAERILVDNTTEL